jgi:hypothetical protein
VNRQRLLEVLLTAFGAILLFIAAFGRHPYGFYIMLRLLVTVCAIYWAWQVYQVGLRGWTWAFVGMGFLLNPFLPIRMQRVQWQPIDFGLGVLLFGWSGYWLFRRAKRVPNPGDRHAPR